MEFLFNFFKGILIGSGAILPGISSGVMCVVFGIYEDLLDRVLNFFKNPADNIRFLIPIVLGGIIGVFLVGKLLLFLFNSYYTATCFAFIGLILGCIPSILKQCSSNTPNKLIHWLCLVLTFTFSIYLIALEFGHSGSNAGNASPFNLGLGGFFMSTGVVIPGVSSSVILMIMGIYETYLTAIANVDFSVLVPMGVGLLLGGYLFLKIINLLFKFLRSYTYFAIIGFTLGSVLVIFPGFSLTTEGIIGITLFITCFIISSFLDKLKKS